MGYEDIVNTCVVSVNGHQIQNLAALVHIVEACTEPTLRFELEYDQLIILATDEARRATPAILATHCVPSQRSADLSKGGARAGSPATGGLAAPGKSRRSRGAQGKAGSGAGAVEDVVEEEEEEQPAAASKQAPSGSRRGGAASSARAAKKH